MTQGGGRKLVSVGNYRLTGKRLGKGNFARVEEAIHSVLNTKASEPHFTDALDVTTFLEFNLL